MRVLVTGAGGFVGRHLTRMLRVTFGDVQLLLTGRDQDPAAEADHITPLDVTDPVGVLSTIGAFAPTHVVHLAGMAAPQAANADPLMAWRIHVDGTLNIARAILARAPRCWLIFAGSAMIYGQSASSGAIDESALLAPVDEYSASKAAADLALGALSRRGLRCIRFRAFNHIGPGQSEAFVVPAFAAQIARIEAGLVSPPLRTGSLDSVRDFLDVRDVASAYCLAINRSEDLEPGLILNIASGIPRRIEDVLRALIARSTREIPVELDPNRLRPSNLPAMVGDATRARGLLAWAPRYEFEQTLADVLADYRCRVSARSAPHSP